MSAPSATPAAPKKLGCRAAKRLESTRASANPSAARKVLCLFNPKDDAVFTGVEDLVVLARLTRRIQDLVPSNYLTDNGIVPLRTRGKSPRNLGFLNVGLQGKDAQELQKGMDALLQFSGQFLQLTPIEAFPDGNAISIVIPEEETVGSLAQYLVIQGKATVLSFSNKVPRHIGFGHAVLVANLSVSQLLVNGGARVSNEADVVQVGLHAAEDSVKVTVHDGIILEQPSLSLAVLGDLERADVEEGSALIQWLSEYLGVAAASFSARVLKDDFA